MATKSTLASRIARAVARDYIETGRLCPGDALPSVRELQGLYGGSVTTIAHALGQLEAQGLVDKHQGRGCFVCDRGDSEVPNPTAQTLGLIVPAPTQNELMIHLHEGVDRAARRHGCEVMVAPRAGGIEDERQHVVRLVAAGCQAIILYPRPRTCGELENDYLANELRGMPIVTVDLGQPEQRRSSVVFDNRRAGYALTRLLIDEGHTRIAMSHLRDEGRELVRRSTIERCEGYLSAMREAGLEIRPQDTWMIEHTGPLFDGVGNPAERVLDLVAVWKEQNDRCSAVIAFHDTCAVAYIEAARLLGVDVPEELRVAGFDNLSSGRHVRPPFPTTAPDFAQAGEQAVELAIRELRGEIREPQTYVLPAPVLPRRVNAAGRVES